MKQHTLKPLLAISALIIVMLACSVFQQNGGSASPVPQPSQINSQPSQSGGQPTVEAATQPSQPSGGSDYFTEDFNGTLDNYKQFLTNGNVNDITVSIQDGYLVFDLPTKNQWVYEYYTPKTYTDTKLEMVADNRGNNDNNISLFCRYSETEGWYEFNVYNSGLYDILYGKWDSNKTTASYATIADGGSTKIKQGKAVNKYTVVCKGNTLTLYLNDNKVKTIDDNQFVLRKGNVGFGVSSFTNLPVKVQVDSFAVSQP